jgi:hypothetical protein
MFKGFAASGAGGPPLRFPPDALVGPDVLFQICNNPAVKGLGGLNE